jgi:hypothetical protein
VHQGSPVALTEVIEEVQVELWAVLRRARLRFAAS